MQAFHNDEKIKQKYLNRIKAHAKADEIVKGVYWENGKGCAVGCTIHSSNHSSYEEELGIPEWLALVEDAIFEQLPSNEAKLWPVKFLSTINIGADLNKIKAPFVIFILKSNFDNFDHSKYPECKSAIDKCIELWEKYPKGPSLAKSTAESAAWSAAWSAARFAARFAAESTAESAASSAAESAAESAASSAAESAARFAAWSAARFAARFAAWSAASSAAWSAAYTKFANKLLQLLKECK